MKKNLFIGLSLAALVMLAGCKSKESNYKKAYEQAKAQELAQQQAETPPVSVTPVAAAQQAAPVETSSNVRSERLNVMNGGTLKAYNVVCGSFSKADNASNLRNALVNAGYSAQVAQNPDTGMYRVIATSFDDEASARTSLSSLRAVYKDAWLLRRSY